MKGFAKLLAFGAVVSLITSFAAFGDAQAEPAKHKFLISHCMADDDPFALGYRDMKEFLEKNGNFDVTIYGNSEFSASEPEALQQTIDGVVQMTQGPTYLLAITSGVKGYFVYDYPGLMSTIEECHKIANSELAEEFAKKVLENTGIIVGRAWVNGRCAIGSSLRSIKTLDDLKGQKIRSMTSDITVPWLSSLGINPIAMPFAEIYTALQQKTIDGVYTPLRFFWQNGYGDIARHILWDQFMFVMQVPMVNGDYYNALPEDQRNILRQGMDLYSTNVHKYTIDRENESVERLKEKGIEVVMLDDATKVQMKELAAKLVAEKADIAGKDVVGRVKQILGKN